MLINGQEIYSNFYPIIETNQYINWLIINMQQFHQTKWLCQSYIIKQGDRFILFPNLLFDLRIKLPKHESCIAFFSLFFSRKKHYHLNNHSTVTEIQNTDNSWWKETKFFRWSLLFQSWLTQTHHNQWKRWHLFTHLSICLS